MSFDWLAFLSFAKALYSDPNSPGPSEAALRSAASRAYYSAFHSALNMAKSEGFAPTYSGQDHSNIQAHFRNYNSLNQIHRKIALELGRLYDLRRQADRIIIHLELIKTNSFTNGSI